MCQRRSVFSVPDKPRPNCGGCYIVYQDHGILFATTFTAGDLTLGLLVSEKSQCDRYLGQMVELR
jgi:hypothetical protein